MNENPFLKVMPEPIGSESVPIVASFSDRREAEAEATKLTNDTGVKHIVVYHPSNEFGPVLRTT